MMLIVVWNSGFSHQDHERELAEELRQTCCVQLGLTRLSGVSVCMLDGWMLPDEPTAIIVDPVFDEPERTREVYQQLVEALGRKVKEIHVAAGLYRKIKVAIKRFNIECCREWA